MMKIYECIWTDGTREWFVEGKRQGKFAYRRFASKAQAKAWRDEVNSAERAARELAKA